MSPSKRNKLLIAGGGALGLIVVLLLIAPLLVGLDSYKPQIVSEVKKATGRDLVIDGPLELSLLPLPSVSTTGVKFFNAAGSKNANMVEIKSLTVRPSVFALLGGNIEVSSLTLVEPKIVLEVDAQGKPNWEFAPSVAEAKPVAPKPTSSRPMSIGELDIQNGTLIFSNSKTGLSVTADKANIAASVGSFDGPYAVKGDAVVNGAPARLDLSVGARKDSGYATSIALEAGRGKLTFKGSLSELGPNARVAGDASVSAESLSLFVETLANIGGQTQPALPPVLAGKFGFDGAIDVSPTAFAAKDFKLTVGKDSGSGSIAVTLAPALSVDGKISIPKLDLESWLAARPAAPSAPAGAAATVPASPNAAPSLAPAGGRSILAGLNGKFALDIGQIDYHGQAARNIAVELEAHNGTVAVPKLTANLPGDLVLKAQSSFSGNTASGDFSLVAPKLRDTLKWAAVDVSSLPPDKLTKLSIVGRMTSSNGEVQVPDATIELDTMKANGGLVVNFGVPLSVTAQVGLDTFDLDAFLANPTQTQKPASQPAPATEAATAAPSKAAVGPIFGLKAKVGKLIYKKQTISGIDLDVGLQGSLLRLNDVKVGNFATARFAVRGTVANYDSALPSPNVAFNFEATDMPQFLKALGSDGPAGLGTVSASGGISGNIESLDLKEFTVSAAGETAKATGHLSMPGAASGQPKSVGYKGSLTANGQTIDGTVEARLTGRPTVTADLKTTMLDLNKLAANARPISPAPSAPARLPARQQPAAAAKEAPIDTSALRAVDGSIKLTAATLISSSMRISNAQIAATLKDGVLTLSTLKGGLYGGTVDLSGALNATQSALAVDLKGDVTGLSVSEILRSTSGTNTFGGTVKVTVDGKINANSITLKGSGATASELKSSMAGGAQLGGHIFAGADKAAVAGLSAATGVVGGVLDNTIGNLLGAVGQRNISPANMLNAASLLLNRFVNRDNAVSGRVDINGGVLTDKSLVVQGDRATANIATRTDLGRSTTDTTVNFVIAEDASAPYVIVTVRGALSSPSYGVSRGTAKDPPGFVNTLEQGVGQGVNTITNPVKSLIPNVPLPNIFGR